MVRVSLAPYSYAFFFFFSFLFLQTRLDSFHSRHFWRTSAAAFLFLCTNKLGVPSDAGDACPQMFLNTLGQSSWPKATGFICDRGDAALGALLSRWSVPAWRASDIRKEFFSLRAGSNSKRGFLPEADPVFFLDSFAHTVCEIEIEIFELLAVL